MLMVFVRCVLLFLIVVMLMKVLFVIVSQVIGREGWVCCIIQEVAWVDVLRNDL